jgi:hypothetical protein
MTVDGRRDGNQPEKIRKVYADFLKLKFFMPENSSD